MKDETIAVYYKSGGPGWYGHVACIRWHLKIIIRGILFPAAVIVATIVTFSFDSKRLTPVVSCPLFALTCCDLSPRGLTPDHKTSGATGMRTVRQQRIKQYTNRHRYNSNTNNNFCGTQINFMPMVKAAATRYG